MTTADMAALYAEGLTLAQVGVRAGITESAVARRLKDAGIARRKPRGAPRKALPVTDAEMGEMYAAGLTLAEIGKAVGMTAPNIGRRLAGISIKRRTQGRVRRDWAPYLAMHEAGASYAEIGAKLGIHGNSARLGILAYLRREGR